jgi:hypothetical protein
MIIERTTALSSLQSSPDAMLKSELKFNTGLSQSR